MADVLESAVPEHLQVPRTQASKLPPNYQPPFPAYSARFPKSIKDLVLAVIGAQSRTTSTSLNDDCLSPLLKFVESNSSGGTSSSPPSFWETASVTDNRGHHNVAVLAYWPSRASYTQWASNSGFESWWESLDPETETTGWFREILFPTMERFETVFSDNQVPEGAAHMREKVSGPIREHVYWGSARDRLPLSQTDPLHGEQSTTSDGTGSHPVTDSQKQRITVKGKQNLAIIRSGQDWSNTYPEERKLYLETMHPVLIKGMDFLRDHGDEIGCYSCRFMDVLPNKQQPPTTVKAGDTTDRTFGLAYFNDLSSLEKWSKEHKTHLDIFGRFLQYAKELQNNVSLRLFHEVLVLQPDQQLFEYVGCHSTTGMLTAAVV